MRAARGGVEGGLPRRPALLGRAGISPRLRKRHWIPAGAGI